MCERGVTMHFLLKQINALAWKEKEYGLSAEEKVEQQALRVKYASLFRSSFEHMLLHTTFVDTNGEDVTPAKLKEMKRLMNEL